MKSDYEGIPCVRYSEPIRPDCLQCRRGDKGVGRTTCLDYRPVSGSVLPSPNLGLERFQRRYGGFRENERRM